ncbi:MAG: ABC transporter ATP-binding protein [Acholeplasmataceae bacterium]|nr:ABC transporter ATP-binding protein [Acholeplasmataceae bacterium]
MNLIEATNVKKSYMTKDLRTDVLRGISMTLKDGEFVSIIGPSGSGKTTFLYTLGGLEPFESGEIMILGQSLRSMSDKAKADMRANDIAYVFQSYNLVPNLTAYENVLMASALSKTPSPSRVKEVLSHVGMTEHAQKYPGELSGGMQQRVAIARAIVNNPKILFADEPIGNLDHDTGLSIMDLFKTLNQTFHMTILMVTHNQDTVSYGTRTLSIFDGTVVRDDHHGS